MGQLATRFIDSVCVCVCFDGQEVNAVEDEKSFSECLFALNT